MLICRKPEHAAISISQVLRYTVVAKKLDTLDTILVQVDHILLLRPFVSSFLLSVVSRYDAAFL